MKLTLTDQELVDKVNDWVSKLAESGGRNWTLEVPVNFDKDPDVLIVELGQRLLAKSQPSAPTEAASGVEVVKNVFREMYGEDWESAYNSQPFERELLTNVFLAGASHASTPPTATPEAAKEQGEEAVYRTCGGCGATHPKDRCIGCGHPFTKEEEKVFYESIESRTTPLPASTALNDERAKGFAEWTNDNKYEHMGHVWIGQDDSVWTRDELYDLYLATLPTPPKK